MKTRCVSKLVFVDVNSYIVAQNGIFQLVGVGDNSVKTSINRC